MAEEIARVTDGINDVNAAWGNAVIEGLAMRSMMPGRLSASSTLAEPTSDLTGVTSLYYKLTNRHGIYGGLFKDGYVRGYDMSAVPALSTADLAHDSVHDVFMHADSDSPAMEFSAWTQPSGTITDATNATPIVVTSAGHGLVNGDIVAVRNVGGNTAANGVFIVANKTTDTFELAASVGSGAYTSGGTWRKQNISEPTRGTQSGFLTKNGDPTRRLLGSILVDAAGGAISSSISRRGVSNLYNTRPTTVRSYNTTSTPWAYTTNTIREFNNGAGQNKGIFVLCVSRLPLSWEMGGAFTGTFNALVGWSIDSLSAFNGVGQGYSNGAMTVKYSSNYARKDVHISAGPHFLTQLEQVSSGSMTNTVNLTSLGIYLTLEM